MHMKHEYNMQKNTKYEQESFILPESTGGIHI